MAHMLRACGFSTPDLLATRRPANFPSSTFPWKVGGTLVEPYLKPPRTTPRGTWWNPGATFPRGGLRTEVLVQGACSRGVLPSGG